MEKIFEKLRKEKPLIHCITNYVTTNDMANVILAIGASPIMADEINEVEDIVDISRGLLLNMGTINKEKFQAMLVAGIRARENYRPIVFDPVGIGASNFRRKAGRVILREAEPDVIKGNISEMKYLYNEGNRQRGVDSEDFELESLDSYMEMCKALAINYKATILMTGEIDIVASPTKLALIKNGNPIMEKITGTGCMLGGVVASFIAVEEDRFKALVASSLLFSIAGERAYRYIKENQLGLGSYKVSLIDNLSKITYKDIEEDMNIEFF